MIIAVTIAQALPAKSEKVEIRQQVISPTDAVLGMSPLQGVLGSSVLGSSNEIVGGKRQEGVEGQILKVLGVSTTSEEESEEHYDIEFLCDYLLHKDLKEFRETNFCK